MASNTDLSKLTVPQLKTLCKERRIAGYSKLNKAALLQKLAGVPAPATTTVAPPAPSTHTAQQHASSATEPTGNVPTQLPEVSQDQTATRRIPSTVLSTPQRDVQQNVVGAAESTKTLLVAKGPTRLRESPQERTATLSTKKTHGAKRSAHIDTSTPAKRIRTSTSTSSDPAYALPAATTQGALPARDSSLFRVPELPAHLQNASSTTEPATNVPTRLSEAPRNPIATPRESSTVFSTPQQDVQRHVVGTAESTRALSTGKVFTPTQLPDSEPQQDRTATSSTQKTHGVKRGMHIDLSAPEKRVKTSASTSNPAHARPILTTSTSQRASPTGYSSVVRPPELPAQRPNASLEMEPTAKVPTRLPEAAQDPMTARRAPSTHIDAFTPTKRIRTSASSSNLAHARQFSTISTSQQVLPARDSFRASELPQPKVSSLLTTPLTVTKQPPASIINPGRFKPLVAARPRPAESGNTIKEHTQASSSSRSVDSSLAFIPPAKPLPLLSQISFPPKASERKWVNRWAIILSALSPAEREACMFVSRTLRYAVYLSAVHILSRDYPGRRLNSILEQHSRNMTNFWPYLRYRMAEVSERRLTFKRSFFGRYADSIGCHPLSQRLWTSPDDEKQVEVALRFVLTRMWFATSIGAYGHDAVTWSRCVVQDVQEVVRGDIWHVTALDDGTGTSCSFYVLEATCEVVGQPGSSSSLFSSSYGDKNMLGHDLRADWTAWISERSRSALTSPDATRPRSILECVTWSNTEDYHQGISKAWSRRIQDQCQEQDAGSVAKTRVAERYVLACVVANGISGQWMTTSTMAQEFAGLPAKNNILGGRTVGRFMDTVNMYLAAHHHIESVHFTTGKGEALHAAVAIVQTPGREYYVLRDNGMQVGCEEEGIPEVWQQMLGCDMLGRAC